MTALHSVIFSEPMWMSLFEPNRRMKKKMNRRLVSLELSMQALNEKMVIIKNLTNCYKQIK